MEFKMGAGRVYDGCVRSYIYSQSEKKCVVVLLLVCEVEEKRRE